MLIRLQRDRLSRRHRRKYSCCVPLYEYQCKKCAHRFEELVRLSDGAPDCPACGAPAAERLFSTSAAVSTGKTRGRAKRAARRIAKAVGREKAHAQAEYERNYIKEHSGG